MKIKILPPALDHFDNPLNPIAIDAFDEDVVLWPFTKDLVCMVSVKDQAMAQTVLARNQHRAMQKLYGNPRWFYFDEWTATRTMDFLQDVARSINLELTS